MLFSGNWGFVKQAGRESIIRKSERSNNNY